jgi:hypothetical protein
MEGIFDFLLVPCKDEEVRDERWNVKTVCITEKVSHKAHNVMHKKFISV